MGQNGNHDRLLLWKRVGAIVVGLAFFVPSFLLAFAVTCWLEDRRWPGDGQAAIVAFTPSVLTASIATILCCIYLLRQVELNRRSKN